MTGQGGHGEDAVRFFGPDDAARLAAFERRFFPHPWTEEQFRAILGGSHFLCCGMTRGGRLAAYLSATLVAGELEILNIAVVPEHRRQGLARRLLGHVLHLARETGMTDAFLEVRASNVPALALYAGFGFREQGRRGAYYPDNREDALVLRLTCGETGGETGGTEGKNRQGAAMSMKFLDEMDISGKRILLRVDYNVPLDGGRITDDLRIRASLPTVRYALDKGASLVVCSHLGKAKGKPDPKFSLAPAAARLSELLGRPVTMAPDCVGPEVEKLVAALKPGQVLMLENLRFHDGEEKNDPDFAKAMAAYGDLFVNDAFGTAHRPHASMVGFPKYAKAACAGFLLKREWEYLGQAMENPARPFVAVSGGAKVSSKLGVLKNLLSKVDRMVIGGAMANTFVAALGFGVGVSLVEPDLYEEARNILALAKERRVSIYLPVDFAVSLDAGKPLAEMKPAGVFPYQNIPPEGMVLDIGPTSARLFAQVLAPAKTVVWNGPMGAFENPDFAEGSLSIARALADLEAVTVVGGGDTDVVVHKAGLADRMTFISTGGGASMEFLEGKELPAFKALKEC